MELNLLGDTIYWVILVAFGIGMIFSIRYLFIIQRSHDWSLKNILLTIFCVMVLFTGMLLFSGGRLWLRDVVWTVFPTELRGTSDI